MHADDHELQKTLGEIADVFGALGAKVSDLMLAEMRIRNPGKFLMLHKLLNAGFSPALSMQILGKTPAHETAQCVQWALDVIAHNLRLSNQDIVQTGGIYALVGTTGVGKTTTTAKLAARAVLQHGSDRVAILSMDNYRIGAYEHLRTYAKMLGIAAYSVKTAEDLQQLLEVLRDKHFVLIDTPGMGQRDGRIEQQAGVLNEARVKNLLLLNAAAGSYTLNEAIRAYRDNHTIGCILTKTDEAVSLGGALDAIIRHKLAMHFITNGQRVPEDLHPPHKTSLLQRALMPHTMQSAFSLQDGECHAVMMPIPKKEQSPSQTVRSN